jgi:alpha-beta hydrolase superfamily lysophospholipase
MFHRGHEHSGRNAHLVDELNLPDFDFFAWDARGHGRSPGARGDSPSLGTSVRDIQTFIDHISATYGIATEDIAVLGQSVGAVLVSTWAHDYAPKVRCLVLASPAFKVKLYVPFARPGLRLMQKLRGNFFVNSYVKSKFLTHDPERQRSFDADPLITRAISVNILLGLYEAAERVVADAQAITVPTQLLISGDDWVVHHKPQHDFFERLGTPIKEKHILAGFYHDTLGEKDRAMALAKVRDFVLRRFAEPRPFVDLSTADQHGPTHDESVALARPLPALSPCGLYWSMTRLGMKIGGCLSAGVKLGHETGFDSGSTLDYVYRNRPTGLRTAGTCDRQELSAVHRLAWHPPTQAEHRGVADQGQRPRSCAAPARAHPRHRRRTRALRARSDRTGSPTPRLGALARFLRHQRPRRQPPDPGERIERICRFEKATPSIAPRSRRATPSDDRHRLRSL